MPPIGEALATAAERNPDATLILAHAAIVDQDRIASLVAGRPNVVFDASAWSPIDLHGLLTRVPPEQLVWASDLPYGTIRESLFATLAVLCEIGADMKTRAAVLGGTAELLLRGEHPTLSAAPLAPRDRVVNLARQRLGGYLTAMLPVIWQRRPDYVGHFGLAAAVCRDEEEQLGGIGDLIRIAERRWELALAGPERPTLEDVRETFEVVLAAWVLAYSPATQARWNELPA